MIAGIGTDIIEVERIEKLARRGKEHLRGIFTEREIAFCEGKQRRAEHYAVRFAAKEATLKALGVGWREGLTFGDVEVVTSERGQPEILVHGKVRELFEARQILRALVSLSHTRDNAMAVVILEIQTGEAACPT